MSAATRVQQFPNQTLKVSARKLYCAACKETLSNLKETIRRHCASTKHVRSVQVCLQSETSECHLQREIAQFYKDNDDLHGVRACDPYA